MFRYQFRDLEVGEHFMIDTGSPVGAVGYVYQKIDPTAERHNARTPTGKTVEFRLDLEVIRLKLPPPETT